MTLPWRAKAEPHSALSAAVIAMAEGDGPDARADQMARGNAILEKHRLAAPELGGLAKLPPFRPVVISLMRLLDRNDVSGDEVARLVQSDPTLAVELLAVVNSPLFAHPASVTSLGQAVSLLGFDTTKSLVFTLGMRSMMQGAPRTPVIRRFWVHSLAVATIAQDFARLFCVDPTVVYVSALLHDLGRLGLLAAYPDDYSAFALTAYSSADEILAAEQAKFGMTHCHAGTLLAKAWSLPDPIQRITEQHHKIYSDDHIVALIQLSCRVADDFLFQAILRQDVQKPEETIAELAPEQLRESLTNRLGDLSEVIIRALQTLDF